MNNRLTIKNKTTYRLSAELLAELETAMDAVLETEGFFLPTEAGLSLVDGREIRSLNRKFRGVDAETDVLSFPMYGSEELESLRVGDEKKLHTEIYLGDIILSVDRALDQASELGHSEHREFVYLTVHSLLHLFGYDHMTDAEKQSMRAKEKTILKRLGIFKQERFDG